MNILQYHWQKGEVPIANGFAFPDGGFVPIDDADIDIFPALLPIRTDLRSALDETIRWTSFHVLAEATHEASGLIAVAGECGMGSDGFVALIDCSSSELEWVLFFDYSNPFEKIDFADHAVVVTNNIHQTWVIPIDARGGVEVISIKKAS